MVLWAGPARAQMPTDYGATPVGAAEHIYRSSDLRLRIHVHRSIATERFAIVVVSSTPMDDRHGETALLLQRFSFGWQPVGVVQHTCDIEHRGISARDRATLLRIVNLEPDDPHECALDERDRGPATDVSAIRRQMYGPVVPFVTIADGYAYALEYGDGGGCGLFRRSHGAWENIATCKGALDPTVIGRYHIPTSTVCALGLYEPDLRCPHRP